MRKAREFRDAVWGATQIAFHVALGPVLHRWRNTARSQNPSSLKRVKIFSLP